MTKILLVEDDKSLSEIYSVRLQAEGYDLISSGDGEQALSVAISERPDLIISDVMMPKISGFEMLDLLRNNNSTKNIPVIILTALSSEQQRERGSNLGANRYLIKSQIGIEDIIRTVHELLQEIQAKNAPSQSIANTSASTISDTTSIGTVTYRQSDNSQTLDNTNSYPTSSQPAMSASERTQSVFSPRGYSPARPAFISNSANSATSTAETMRSEESMVADIDTSALTADIDSKNDGDQISLEPAMSTQNTNASLDSVTVESNSQSSQRPSPEITGHANSGSISKVDMLGNLTENGVLPSANQSPFNPTTATNPSSVVGVDSPAMPDQPFNIPAVSVPPVKTVESPNSLANESSSPVIDIDKLLAEAGDDVVNPAIFPSNQ